MGSRELDIINFSFFMAAVRQQGGKPLEHLDRDAAILNDTPKFWLVNGEPVIIENVSTVDRDDHVDYKYLVHYPDDQEQGLFNPRQARSRRGAVIREPGTLPIRADA